MTELSVVVPVYGCRGSLRELVRRIEASVAPIVESFELVLVDDRSPDGAWDLLAELAAADPRVHAVRLSRNFGQHAAITAGLSRSRGRWTVVMDCDLQEPPEEIPRLYAKAREGYDVVRSRRRGRSHPALRRAASRLHRSLLLRDGGARYSTLSILSRKVVDAVLRLRDRDREYLLMLDWLGFEQTTIEFEHAARPEGDSAYDLRRLLVVGLDGLFFRTTVLLRIVVALGAGVTLAGLAFGAYVLYAYFTVGAPTGYTSLALLVILLSGFIIASLGVVGLYVGRTFEQVRERPLFVVDEELTGEEAEAAQPLRAEREP